uniref:Uncharacterized protein n=1 Tax=Rhizophora mucronata TaxID=61149 RepID=A0A2P2QAG7_RHIMU
MGSSFSSSPFPSFCLVVFVRSLISLSWVWMVWLYYFFPILQIWLNLNATFFYFDKNCIGRKMEF